MKTIKNYSRGRNMYTIQASPTHLSATFILGQWQANLLLTKTISSYLCLTLSMFNLYYAADWYK